MVAGPRDTVDTDRQSNAETKRVWRSERRDIVMWRGDLRTVHRISAYHVAASTRHGISRNHGMSWCGCPDLREGPCRRVWSECACAQRVVRETTRRFV